MDYKRSEAGILVRLYRGEEIHRSLTALAEAEGIEAAEVQGIGAVGEAELGYFDPEKREYLRRTFRGAFEVTNLSGNLTRVEGKPFLHAHITLGDVEYRAFTGHLFSGVISVTGEIVLRPLALAAGRAHDEASTLKLLDLGGPGGSRLEP
jgi:predicted DNA-binding protein with PD1-like motif